MGEPASADAPPRRWGRRRRRLLAVAAVVAVAFSAVTARVFVWPSLPALPARADAIIELAGPGQDGRDARALALAHDHRAAVLVQSTTETEAGTDTCLPSVPDVTILCFHADPDSTRGEARAIASLASERHWTSVILVTTPDQALRAELRVSRCFPGKVYVSTTPLPPSDWAVQIPYQWAAMAKALLLETSC